MTVREQQGKARAPRRGALPQRPSRFLSPLLSLILLVSCTSPGRLPGEKKLLRQPAPEALRVPVDGVAIEELRDSFGAPRSGGRSHEGIDIPAPRNTPVRSTVEGVVERVVRQKLGGRTVSILGPAGQRHYYAHLERWARLRRGERVQAGEVIGWVGDSGNARGLTHLHYALYLRNGWALNPYPLLRAGGGPFD